MGNQDGKEQDKERERIKRRIKMGKRNIWLLISFLLLSDNDKYTLIMGENQLSNLDLFNFSNFWVQFLKQKTSLITISYLFFKFGKGF
jgi:hypothetical protein